MFIFALSSVFKDLDNPINMAGYACGFAAGTVTGITLEQWIAVGEILVRCISRGRAQDIRDRLLADGYGLTVVPAVGGREGEVLVLFIVCPRKRGKALLKLIRDIDPDAFVTIEPVTRASGGFIPHVAERQSVRK